MSAAPETPRAPATGWHAISAADALTRLDASEGGLSSAEARRRLERYGPNALRPPKPVSAWRILLAQLESIVVLLLFVAAAIALLTGDPLDAAAIGAVLVINTTIGFVTELRARRAMQALLELEVARATVVRDGRTVEIDAREVVPGDVIVLEAGQSVPADGRLLSTAELRVNEAALTGESLPVQKSTDPLPADTPLPDRTNMVFKSTTVAAGSARAVVTATGMATEVGRIGELVGGIAEEETPLERRLDQLGRRLVYLALGVAGLVIALGAAQGIPLGQMLETGIALAIAAVPEGLPAVATITLALGLRRMARRNALIRRLPAVETLGSVTAICTDKTGTLTAGEMTTTILWLDGRELHLTGVGYAPQGEIRENGRRVRPSDDPVLYAALRIAVLANRADVVRQDGAWVARGDPTEAALLVAARKAGIERDELRGRYPETGEIPFSSERMLMATFHRTPDGGDFTAVKGAPGRIVALCTRQLTAEGERDLDDEGRRHLIAINDDLARRGLRVLALAQKSPARDGGAVAGGAPALAREERSGMAGAPAPARAGEAAEEGLSGLTFVGFAGLMDPPAEGVKETIAAFRRAGIRVVMLTGDQRLTAEAIARDLGVLGPGDETLDGRELARLEDEELAARVHRAGAFSRVSPEDKLRIVDAYQRGGEIVAMLGDGVNDAAAMKKAHIGVAMGQRGTDVAKESASLVLRDDRFPTIAAAIEEGRVIFDNIRKFVFYLFSCNLAEVLVLLGAGIAGLPLPLTAIQILWLNLVTDTFPALALALEPAEPDIMDRPPRDPHAAILSARFLRAIAFYSALITAPALAAFLWSLDGSRDPAYARTLCFMTLALGQVFHLGNARSPAAVIQPRLAVRNPYALGALGITLALQFLAVHFAPLAAVLETTRLSPGDWLTVVGLALIPAVIGQTLKLRHPTISGP
ncbi:MAG TPA: cation-translocating P-type ATPase [Longimicrobiales bacterium]